MDFKFYIVTRFNAACFPDRLDLADRRLDTDWLKERMRLFRKYCYPSVLNQSWSGFEWILLCHPDGPGWMIDELRGMDGLMIVHDAKYDVRQADGDTLITTRLDSDDMLHSDFMRTIHEYLPRYRMTRHHKLVYSFENGYRYHERIGPNGEMRLAYQKSNPFLTLFATARQDERTDTVYCTSHARLPETFPTHYDTNLSAWCWVKHDANTGGIAAKDGGGAGIETLHQFGVKHD